VISLLCSFGSFAGETRGSARFSLKPKGGTTGGISRAGQARVAVRRIEPHLVIGDMAAGQWADFHREDPSTPPAGRGHLTTSPPQRELRLGAGVRRLAGWRTSSPGAAWGCGMIASRGTSDAVALGAAACARRHTSA
jgi:hypothetical protein